MIDNKYKGFIASKVDYNEADCIINVITTDGKITFKARGIKKITSKNASSCNYFMVSEFITTSKKEDSNKTLKSSNLIKLYKKPYQDILVSSVFLYICALNDKLASEINGYDLSLVCFDKLEDGVSPLLVANYFLKYLLNGLGYTPNLNGCVNCNNKSNLISFDIESGGFICKNCFDSNMHESLPANFLKNIYESYKKDELIEFDNLQAIKLFKMYNNFLKEHLAISVNEYEFILKCL